MPVLPKLNLSLVLLDILLMRVGIEVIAHSEMSCVIHECFASLAGSLNKSYNRTHKSLR